MKEDEAHRRTIGEPTPHHQRHDTHFFSVASMVFSIWRGHMHSAKRAGRVSFPPPHSCSTHTSSLPLLLTRSLSLSPPKEWSLPLPLKCRPRLCGGRGRHILSSLWDTAAPQQLRKLRPQERGGGEGRHPNDTDCHTSHHIS